MIIERILSLLDEKSLKMVDLCRYLEINTSTMTNWKKRGTDPPAKFIAPICEFLDVNCEFLLTGKKNESAFLSDNDSEWLELIHELPHDAQLEFKGEIRGYLKHLNKKSVVADEPLKKTGTTNSK